MNSPHMNVGKVSRVNVSMHEWKVMPVSLPCVKGVGVTA
jgi:hypothetical protein